MIVVVVVVEDDNDNDHDHDHDHDNVAAGALFMANEQTAAPPATDTTPT